MSRKLNSVSPNSSIKAKTSFAVAIICLTLTISIGFWLRPMFTENSVKAMNLTKPESTLVSASDNKVFIATEESPHEFNSNIANAKETTTNEDTFAKNELQIQEVNGTPLWAKNFRFEQKTNS